MKVFIKFGPGDADRFCIAARSWRLRGWTVRLLLPGMEAPRRGRVVPSTIINYAFKRGAFRPWSFNRPGWKKAKLVRFPDHVTEQTILLCGRAL